MPGALASPGSINHPDPRCGAASRDVWRQLLVSASLTAKRRSGKRLIKRASASGARAGLHRKPWARPALVGHHGRHHMHGEDPTGPVLDFPVAGIGRLRQRRGSLSGPGAPRRWHDQVAEETSEGLRGGVAVELLDGRIPIPDTTIQIGDDDSVGDWPEDVRKRNVRAVCPGPMSPPPRPLDAPIVRFAEYSSSSIFPQFSTDSPVLRL